VVLVILSVVVFIILASRKRKHKSAPFVDKLNLGERHWYVSSDKNPGKASFSLILRNALCHM
jgi:hypothetical protein